jgi:hypothetical protein
MDRPSWSKWLSLVYGTHERWAISSKRPNQRDKRKHRLTGAERRVKGKRLREGNESFFRLQYVSKGYLLYCMEGLLVKAFAMSHFGPQPGTSFSFGNRVGLGAAHGGRDHQCDQAGGSLRRPDWCMHFCPGWEVSKPPRVSLR